MRFLISRWALRWGATLLVILLLAGCAAGRGDYKSGERALAEGNYAEAVQSFMAALEKDADNHQYRLKLQHARDRASQAHRHLGDKYFELGDYQRALEEYQQSVLMDGSNFTSAAALQRAEDHLKAQKLTADAEGMLKARRLQQAEVAVAKALDLVNDYLPALKLQKQLENTAYTIIDGVELEVTSKKPITLNFTNAKLPDVFDILTSLSGINFILDEDVRGNNTTLYLEKATFAQALELLLQMNKLDKKILNRKTIILFPKTRDKQKQFEDQLIQTFYLSNIDAKKAVNLLRTMLQVRKIYVHEELNAIIIRDTPAVIKLASKIIEANDRSNSEVVFDLELIEVSHSDGFKFGPRLGAYEIQIGIDEDTPLQNVPDDAVTSNIGSVVVKNFDNINPLYGLPSASFDFLKEMGDGEVLASPKIRVKNKEKAKVHIGTREPVITVTINGDQTSENVQYVDVGVKLDVEPLIQLDNTVVTKLGLEVSNVSGRTTTENGTAVLTISTTNANTALTLKDGERTVIGGLLRDSNTKSKTTVPILGDIPLLGLLFTSYENTKTKSEILLSITPHIVKSVALPDNELASIWSGGEDDLKYGRNFGSFTAEYLAGQKALEPDIDFQDETDEMMEPTATLQPQAQPQQQSVPTIPPAPPVAPPVAPVEGSMETPSQLDLPVIPPTDPIVEERLPPTAQPANLQQPTVFVLGPELVKVGEPFTLVFSANEMNELFSAPLYVQYDENLFEFVNATEGELLQQGGSQTIFTHTALAGSGRIIVGLKQGAGGQGASGGGELFSMEFSAKQAGKGTIEPTRTNFRNPQGVRLKVETVGLEIQAQ